MSDGIIHKDAHWASDLSGEEQPPFEGWFVPVKDQSGRILYYMEIREPVSWKPKEEICEDATKEHRRKKRKARVS